MQIDPATPPVRPGEVLAGKYRVEKLLGEGGMGVVVKATNIALDQPVAIKLLRSAALQHAEALGRFEREAKAAARLKSQHVARALDVGKLEDGRPYIVMEHLEGMDLGDLIDNSVKQQQFIPVHEAVDYVLQTCEAVAEAHGERIVHRDLKPRNLFLTQSVDGRPLVKVLDFGISKIEGNPQDLQLTRTTEIIGSPSYMSPEQLRASRDVDSRTDIWALGVILYELLSTRLPFYGNTVTELVAVVLMEREPALRTMRNDIPPELELVISHCLQKDPNQRIQTVVELAQALQPFAGGNVASFADRVRGVAFQSGRLSGNALPPLPSSGQLPRGIRTSGSLGGGNSPSARVNVNHAGTSVAWGETQVDPPKKSGSKAPLVLGIMAALLFVGGGAIGGTLWYTKQHTAVATPPLDPMPLPSGRKDLTPIPTTTVPEPAASIAIEAPSSLPETRLPSTGTAKTPATARPNGKAPATATTPSTGKPPDDPLSNIGRR